MSAGPLKKMGFGLVAPGLFLPAVVSLVASALAVAIAAALALLLTRPAAGHDWYPIACCRGSDAGGDCAPIAAARVQATAAGYLIDGQFLKTYGETRWSPDGRYHACFPSVGRLSCFFAPERGM